MKLLQIKFNHCEAAQELLNQTVFEKRVDVVLICEQHKNPSSTTWISDNTKKAKHTGGTMTLNNCEAHTIKRGFSIRGK